MKARMIGGLLAGTVLAGAMLLASADSVSAEPLVYVSVLGRVAGSGAAFSDTVAVQAGSTLDYQLWVELAALGTHNSSNPPGVTITSLTPGVDGISNLKFNLGEAADQPIQVDFASSISLADGWWGEYHIGWNGGTVTARGSNTHDIMNIRPIQLMGVWVGVPATDTPAAILVGTGTALVTTLGSGGESVVRASYLLPASINTTFVVGAYVNNAGSAVLGSTSDTDPILGFQDMHLTPEPGTLALLAAGGLVAAWRRRAG